MENYGNGPSTGQIQSGARRISTMFRPEDLHMSTEDRQVLRELAERVSAIAASPEMAEKRELWRKLNSLEKIRPVIFCEPENGWNEIITEKQMMCKGRMARHWEMDLRKEIFWGEQMGDDRPVEPYFNILPSYYRMIGEWTSSSIKPTPKMVQLPGNRPSRITTRILIG